MNDPNRLNRPSLKYSNYFSEPPPSIAYSTEDASLNRIQKASWIVLGLCFIPFIGGIFSLASIILGVILITKDRIGQGLIAIIAAPIASTIASVIFFIYVIAAAGAAGAAAFEKELKALPTPFPTPTSRSSLPSPRPNTYPITFTNPRTTPPTIPQKQPPAVRAVRAETNGQPISR